MYSEVLKEPRLQDIVDGNFRQVIVSPEIVTSSEFHRAVTSKVMFTDRLRVVNIDEAHCINIWGGSFRPDYSELGILRGRIPKNVPFLLASATLPEHVLDDIRLKLRLPKDVKMVRVTNARPNVALSVRAMQKKEKSMGDLRFLIPPRANKPEDIKITLVYCNQRGVAEDGADYARDWVEEEEHGIPNETIAFYHALIGEKRKREIEEKLAQGEICILFCTDAVGMVSFGIKLLVLTNVEK
jgi:superfamily II DNA helicase RecQ